jgi:hypothetical protein
MSHWRPPRSTEEAAIGFAYFGICGLTVAVILMGLFF